MMSIAAAVIVPPAPQIAIVSPRTGMPSTSAVTGRDATARICVPLRVPFR